MRNRARGLDVLTQDKIGISCGSFDEFSKFPGLGHSDP